MNNQKNRNMRLNMQFAIAAFLALTVIISSCDTFKDEMTPGSYSETVKYIDGNWQLATVFRNGIDITEYMDFSAFHIILKKDNTYEIKTEIGFSTVDGKRRLTIKLSPGCHTNTYVYTFKQVIE